MNPAREEPSFLIPLPKYFSARVPFSTADFEASRRSMACHKTHCRLPCSSTFRR
jgi:hypothetical protein